jgi:hypothetical protein
LIKHKILFAETGVNLVFAVFQKSRFKKKINFYLEMSRRWSYICARFPNEGSDFKTS